MWTHQSSEDPDSAVGDLLYLAFLLIQFCAKPILNRHPLPKTYVKTNWVKRGAVCAVLPNVPLFMHLLLQISMQSAGRSK